MYMNIPVPLAKLRGTEYDKFAIVSIEQAVDHLLAHRVPLKTLDYNVMSD
jgi:hypothetical protein